MAGFAVPQFYFQYQGSPAAGGSVNVYQTGTTTPVTCYSDGGLTTPISNPITLDANGGCKFYTSGSVNLRMDAYTSTGTLIESIDPVYPTGTTQTLSPGIFTTEASLASAASTDLGSVTTTNIINITGTTTITSLGSSANTNNPLYFTRFSGILTLTNNASSLILPGNANITTAAGDAAVWKYEGSGNWRCISYNPASGKAIAPSVGAILTASLTAVVPLLTTNVFVDAISVAQGTTGTFLAIGTVTSLNTATAATYLCKLWDGTTVIDSGATRTSAGGIGGTVSLSGVITNPAGNIKISGADNASNAGTFQFNYTGGQKDTTLTVIKLA